LRQIQINVHASGFGPNEAVKIIFDGLEVACTTTNADENGIFNGVFTIPPDIPTGTKLVTLQGTYSTGSAYFTGVHSNRTIVNQYVHYITPGDPLSQSFNLTQSRHVSGVDFWLEDKGVSTIRIQLRTMDNGFPTGTVLAECRIKPEDLTAKAWNRAIFDTPAFLNAGVEYAITILADTSDHTVGIAELGDFDSETGWVRSQAYSEGVLFSSSNASTWTPHQNADLAFKLLAANFTENTKIVNLGSYDLTGITDIMPLAEVESTNSDTYVTFILKQNDTETARMQAWQHIAFNTVLSGEYTLLAELSGSSKFSPVLGRCPQIITGSLGITGDYVSRAFSCGQNKKIMITTTEYSPHGSAIEVFVQTDELTGGHTDNVWTLANEISENTELGNGWIRRTRFVSCNIAAARLKIVLHGSASARPLVQSISAVVLDA